VLEIVPGEADQVTATFEVLVTSAVNCWVPADTTVAVRGETVTCIAGGLFDDWDGLAVETPEQAERKKSEDTNVIRNTHRDRSA
jgi:hypothetical protein